MRVRVRCHRVTCKGLLPQTDKKCCHFGVGVCVHCVDGKHLSKIGFGLQELAPMMIGMSVDA